MGFCIWGLSWLSCGIVGIFKGLLGLFMPDIPGAVVFIVALVVSSILIYILGIFLGKIGGILLMIVGLIGALITAGVTLILTLIGFLLMFFGKPDLLVLLNIGLFALCAACYGL